MQSKAEQPVLEKSGSTAPIDLHAEVASADVIAVHESEDHKEYSSTLKSAHPEAGTTKDAAVLETNPSENLVQIPSVGIIQTPGNQPVKQARGSFEDTSFWNSGFNTRQRERGKLKKRAA